MIGVATFGFQNKQDPDPNRTIALILGAGIINNKLPSEVLKNRLDKGKDLFKQGKVKALLVSGDNKEVNYNEPKVMRDYLISEGIPESVIFQDFGGRRTFDSCWRAKNVFNATNVIVVTQAFHIPKSILVCKEVGLNVGFASAKDSGFDTILSGTIREIPAIWVSLFQTLGYEAPVKADGTEPDLS